LGAEGAAGGIYLRADASSLAQKLPSAAPSKQVAQLGENYRPEPLLRVCPGMKKPPLKGGLVNSERAGQEICLRGAGIVLKRGNQREKRRR